MNGRKLARLIAVFIMTLMLSSLLLGCETQSALQNRDVITDSGEIVVDVPRTVYGNPWEWAGDTAVSGNGFAAGDHIVWAEPDRTVAVVSLSGDEQPKPESFMLMNDERGYAIQSSSPLGQVDDVTVWAVTFPAREANITHLGIQLDENVRLPLLVSNGGEDALKSSMSFYREGYVEQGGLRISFNGWGLTTLDRLATTESMDYETALAEEVERLQNQGIEASLDEASGILHLEKVETAVLGEATLRFERTSDQTVQFIYLYLLPDGRIPAQLILASGQQ